MVHMLLCPLQCNVVSSNILIMQTSCLLMQVSKSFFLLMVWQEIIISDIKGKYKYLGAVFPSKLVSLIVNL